MSLSSDASPSQRLAQVPGPDFLVYIRHGQTDWNAEGRMQGQKDIPLNQVGEGQASGNGKRLAAFLKAEGMDPLSLDFVSSPLGRTRRTMDLVRAELGLAGHDYRLEPEVREITFGDWEGSTLEELALEFPEKVAERRVDKWGFVPPNGESYEMLTGRIGAWLATVRQPTVVVAHGGVFRIVRGLLEGLETRHVPKLEAPQDRMFLWRNGTGSWI
ncbi:histidine phosphatase family protein [Roseibium sediminis]|uniref:histidine phosphatase family protein n=1 Tax=Roseibium sediminis TaxID=1775174 RepID=UPI00123C835B|nr:histidine phosphatase family protein [Roseibium sediminis]